MSSAAPSPCIVYHPLVSCCLLLPLLSCFLPPAYLASSTSSSCCVIHCPLAPYILYLNLIVAIILLSLPLPPHHLSQRPLNATSTMECPRPSLPSNTIFICHGCCLPSCPSPPYSGQMPSLPPPLFAILSSFVTAAAFPIHCHHQTPPPAIATRWCSCQMPSLLPPPFAAFHHCVHQTPSNTTALFECLCSPQMAAAAAGG